jgi:hypothetical protein
MLPAEPTMGRCAPQPLRTCSLAASALVALVALPRPAASQAPRNLNQPALREIDQQVQGRNDLAASTRKPFSDLRLPLNFDRLYEVDSSAIRSRAGIQGRAFARASGGLVAVFPRTDDRRLAPGVNLVGVPPGTVYLFADTATWTGMTTDRSRTSSPNSLVQRIEQPPLPGNPFANPPPPVKRASESDALALTKNDIVPSGPTIWTNEQWRAGRVGALLDRALGGR